MVLFPTIAASGCAALALWLGLRRRRERAALPSVIEQSSDRGTILLGADGEIARLGDHARELLGFVGRCDRFGVDDIPIQGFAARLEAYRSPVLDDARCAEPMMLCVGDRAQEIEGEIVPLRPEHGPMPAVFSFAPVQAVQFEVAVELEEELASVSPEAEEPAEGTAPAEEASGSAPEKKKKPTPLDGKRILLAEDGPDNQLLMSYTILGLGADLTLVENGAEAVARIEESSFDVVLLDLQMPVMDGFTAARKIRELCPGVIMIAVSARDDATEECEDAGFDGTLAKPLRRGSLVRRIEEIQTARQEAANAEPDVDASIAAAEDAQDEWAQLLEDPEFRAMVDEFRAEMPERIREMRAAADDDQWTTVGDLAHRLKGAAGGFGLLDVSSASADLENSVRRGEDRVELHREALERLDALVQQRCTSSV